MPKIAKELSALEVKRLNTPGWHAVGGVAGLLLQIRPPAKPTAAMPRSWLLRIRIGGQRQPVGLGSYPQVSLAEARDQAKKAVGRSQIRCKFSCEKTCAAERNDCYGKQKQDI